ncbi:hypothetical protein KIPB_002314 [Kipferlia bialata]|uniref:Uncharacterized protein n=1 Tax=Kipferlia bialata TaxID=797122 RepID=A0A9K3CRK7_9EUKA|nr:hypothetical protein KIPB_002314 [Kipferlia bialata]|eukprot:g2314.t1
MPIATTPPSAPPTPPTPTKDEFKRFRKIVLRNLKHCLDPFLDIGSSVQVPPDPSAGMQDSLQQFQKSLGVDGPVLVAGAGTSIALAHNALLWGGLLEKVNGLMFESETGFDCLKEISKRMDDVVAKEKKEQKRKTSEMERALEYFTPVHGRTPCSVPLIDVLGLIDGSLAASPSTAEVSAVIGHIQRISVGWKERCVELRAEMVSRCLEVYQDTNYLREIELSAYDDVLFDWCLAMAKEAHKQSSARVVAEQQDGGEEAVLVAYRLVSLALVLALDHLDDRDMLSRVVEELNVFVTILPGLTSSFHAVSGEARLLLGVLETSEAPKTLKDPAVLETALQMMPPTDSLIYTETVWARGRILEQSIHSSNAGDRRYVESVIDLQRVQLPVAFPLVALRCGLRAFTHLPGAFITSLNYDRILEVVLNRKTRYIHEIAEQYDAVASLKDVMHLHGVSSGDSSVHYALTFQEYCKGHLEFLKALLGSRQRAEAGRDRGGILLAPAAHGTPVHIRPMVFIGVGGTLEDPHFLGLFEILNRMGDATAGGSYQAGVTYGPQRHFVIGRDPVEEVGLKLTVDRLRLRFPNLNLTYLEYGANYDDLGPFLTDHAIQALGRRLDADTTINTMCKSVSLQVHKDIKSICPWEQEVMRSAVTSHAFPALSQDESKEVKKALKERDFNLSDFFSESVMAQFVADLATAVDNRGSLSSLQESFLLSDLVGHPEMRKELAVKQRMTPVELQSRVDTKRAILVRVVSQAQAQV